MRWCWVMLVLAGLAVREARGCGLHWSKPVNHFDGVCEEGYVSHWEDWGTVDFGDGLKLPLIVGFRSDRNTDSPYLGRGWIVALLKSHAYALDERHLRVVMPDGYHYTFRKQKNGVWDGNRGWLGEFKGNTFTAWAPCGWKIQWRDGKIQTMWTDKGRKIDYNYNGAMCTGIGENGRERVKIARNPSTGSVDSLMLAKDANAGHQERIAITLDKKPEVQLVSGRPVVNAFSHSLSRAEWSSERGRKMDYQFGVSDTLLPTLKLLDDGGVERRFGWDPTTRFIVSDEAWSYKITPAARGASVEMERLDPQGHREIWHRDRTKGLEVIGRDNEKQTRQWFVAGPAAGRTRKYVQSRDNLERVTFEATYDSAGRLVATTRGGRETYFFYDEDNRWTGNQRDGGRFAVHSSQKVLESGRFMYDAQGLRKALFQDGITLDIGRIESGVTLALENNGRILRNVTLKYDPLAHRLIEHQACDDDSKVNVSGINRIHQ